MLSQAITIFFIIKAFDLPQIELKREMGKKNRRKRRNRSSMPYEQLSPQTLKSFHSPLAKYSQQPSPPQPPPLHELLFVPSSTHSISATVESDTSPNWQRVDVSKFLNPKSVTAKQSDTHTSSTNDAAPRNLITESIDSIFGGGKKARKKVAAAAVAATTTPGKNKPKHLHENATSDLHPKFSAPPAAPAAFPAAPLSPPPPSPPSSPSPPPQVSTSREHDSPPPPKPIALTNEPAAAKVRCPLSPRSISRQTSEQATRDKVGSRPRLNSTDGELLLPSFGLCEEQAVLSSFRWEEVRERRSARSEAP